MPNPDKSQNATVGNTVEAAISGAAAALKDGAKEAGREALESVRSGLSAAASEAKTVVSDEAMSRAAAGKDKLAEEGERLAQGLRDAAAAQRDDSLQGRLLETVADSLADMSVGLRKSSPASLMRDMNRFARRHPGAFVAGAALAGFALARFARTSAPPSDPTVTEEATP